MWIEDPGTARLMSCSSLASSPPGAAGGTREGSVRNGADLARRLGSGPKERLPMGDSIQITRAAGLAEVLCLHGGRTFQPLDADNLALENYDGARMLISSSHPGAFRLNVGRRT